jgi:hypothetical protein
VLHKKSERRLNSNLKQNYGMLR